MEGADEKALSGSALLGRIGDVRDIASAVWYLAEASFVTGHRRAVVSFGENGVIDMIGVAGYFTTVSMVINVAHSPPQETNSVGALLPYPF